MSTNDTPPAVGRFQAGILAALEQYERDRAAETPHDGPGTLDSTRLLTLAQDYARATTPEQRDSLAAGIADRLTLAEAGTIRRAAKAVELGTPGIICRAAADGRTSAEIAHELGATPSYVRRIIRENPGLVSEAFQAAANDAKNQLWTGRRIWRLERQWDADNLPKGSWHTVETKQASGGLPRTDAEFAQRKLDGAQRDYSADVRLRVTVWRDGDTPDPDAVVAYSDPQ
ncbi:hypothetical protein [Streptomyces sp. NPDC002403]